DERDASLEGRAAAPRVESRDLGAAAGGVEEPGQDLDRRRLAGAVRAEEAHDLAGLDAERDVLDRAHLAVARPKDRPQGAGEPGLAHLHAVRLGQPLGDDARAARHPDPRFLFAACSGSAAGAHAMRTLPDLTPLPP